MAHPLRLILVLTVISFLQTKNIKNDQKQKEDYYHHKDPSVLALNPKNFEIALKKYHYLFNFVFSGKDIYAKALCEELERFAYKQDHSKHNKTQKGSAIKIARLEYEHNISSAKSLETKNIPEMQFIVEGKVKCRKTNKYITLKIVKRFINDCYFSQAFYPLKTTSKDEWKDLLSIYDLNIVYVGDRNDYHARRQAYWTLKHHDDYKSMLFFYVDSKELGEEMGLKWNSMGLYRAKDKKMVPYKQPLYSTKMMKEWIWINSFPSYVMIDKFQSDRFLKHNYPIFVLYVNSVTSMKGMNALMDFEKAAVTLQENKYLAMIVDLSLHKDISGKFAQDMEFNPSDGLPRVYYYHPAHVINPEHVNHYSMKTPITYEGIIKFMDDIKANVIAEDLKNDKNFKLVSDLMVQDISYYNIKSTAFSVQKKNYDLVVLFYHSKDWNQVHSKKAQKEFNHAATVLGKRIEHIQSFKGSEEVDFPVRLQRYDLSMNTRRGLNFKPSDAPIVRIYRLNEGKFWVDHKYEMDHPKDIIHFIYDQATEDLQQDEHIEDQEFSDLGSDNIDM